jgi:RNA polymerase sigma-70 factor, ECF subfamily
MVSSDRSASEPTWPAQMHSIDLDGPLVLAAKSDRAAFAPLYQRYADLIYRYCLRRLSNKEAAEDATAQVFAKVLAALPTYQDERSSFRSWLFAIAHNVLIDTSRARRPQHALDDGLLLVDPELGPEEMALASDSQREVQVLLSAVPPEQRRVLELRLAGLSTGEISRALGCSAGAVRASQYRAITRLRLLIGLAPSQRGGEDA